MRNNIPLVVGNRVTYRSIYNEEVVGEETIIIQNKDAKLMLELLVENGKVEIIRVEAPAYEEIEFVEEKKELLTEEEREFLKQFIKFDDYIINSIKKTKHRFNFYSDNIIVETMEVAEKYFNNLEYGREYTLQELGLEEE